MNLHHKIIQGVYKIENKINHKIYIGISNDILERWEQHIANAHSIQPTCYNKVLSAAFRKYGVENFSFDILQEENNEDKRKELEKYYIQKYNSYGKGGYNMTPGGDGNPRNKLTKQDVIDIRTRYKNLERCMIVYQDYKDRIGRSGFNKIWKGATWKTIMPEIYTPERIHYHKTHTGNSGFWNGRALLPPEEVKKIRERYEKGEPVSQIYEDYKHLYKSRESFWQLVKGMRYKL